jgi:hypothetical protein
MCSGAILRIWRLRRGKLHCFRNESQIKTAAGSFFMLQDCNELHSLATTVMLTY